MTRLPTAASNAPAGVWRRAAESSAVWRALTPSRRAWAVVEDAIAHVTMRRETEADDRRVERFLASSMLGEWAYRGSGVVVRASRDSRTIGWGRRRLQALADLDAVTRLRCGAQVVVIASFVALAAQMIGPRPATLAMIVPGAAAIGALLVWLLARSFAAAWNDRR